MIIAVILTSLAMGLLIRNIVKLFRAMVWRGYFYQAINYLHNDNMEKLAAHLDCESFRWRLNGRPYLALVGYYACRKLGNCDTSRWREINLKFRETSGCINDCTLGIDDAKDLEELIKQEFAGDAKALPGKNLIVHYAANLLLFCIVGIILIFLLARS